MNTPLRLLYVSGPGDVINTYTHWRDGQDDPSEVNVTYSGQFFDVCRDESAQACVISTTVTRATLRDAHVTVCHRPIPFAAAGPALYHLGQLLFGFRILLTAAFQRTDVLVIARGTHWFLLAPLTWLGVRVVPTLHCVLWPKYGRRSMSQRWIDRCNGAFFKQRAFAIMSASDDIDRQVCEITDGRPKPIVAFLPLYRRESFQTMPPAEWSRRNFRVLYAGRIEAYKGVFDLLDIARNLHAAGYREIEFDLCGTGAAFHELKQRTEACGLAAAFRLHGHCGRDVMQAMFAKAHAVIVPTTTRFVEGFNQVVVESILSGRPVVTSSVCPALAYVRDAVAEVPPDDVSAYIDAIRRLYDDRAWYERKQSACAALQEQFYDRERSWYASLRHVLAAHRASQTPTSVSWLPPARTMPPGRSKGDNRRDESATDRE